MPFGQRDGRQTGAYQTERPSLADILLSRLLFLQGWRQYWAADDTSLFAVRQSQGSVFIDQIEVVRCSLLLTLARFETVIDPSLPFA